MKCRVCRGPAVIDVRRHNAGFCREHFVRHCEEQVRRAIHDQRMLTPDDRVLVAVSGGKDSLALWDLLVGLGYRRRRPLPRARHRRLLRRVGPRTRATTPQRARPRAAHGRPRGRLRLHDPGRGRGDAPRALRRVRALEASPLQLVRARPRLRRRRDRSQPRRRGRGAARQRAALGGRRTSGVSTRCSRRRPASCGR